MMTMTTIDPLDGQGIIQCAVSSSAEVDRIVEFCKWANHAADRMDELTELLEQKDKDRRYHMDAINRLASFLAFHGTSFEVIQAAIDNMRRMAEANLATKKLKVPL